MDVAIALIYIGTGGWAYLKGEEKDKLIAYSKLFNFVEVNSTFYIQPPLSLVKSWRRRAPSEFRFSVRCHRDVTHRYALRSCKESIHLFERMLEICRILKAPIMHLQTPPSVRFDRRACQEARDFFSAVMPRDIRLAWEVRGGLNEETVELMRDLNIVPSVDLSREEPPAWSDILYSRLFGRGFHTLYEFDDDELIDIERRISRGEYKQVFLVFHSLRMYDDARRLKTHMMQGFFPAARLIGLEGLREALSKISFPASRDQVIQRIGWEVIHVAGRNIHLSKLLEKASRSLYWSLDDVIAEVKAGINQ